MLLVVCVHVHVYDGGPLGNILYMFVLAVWFSSMACVPILGISVVHHVVIAIFFVALQVIQKEKVKELNLHEVSVTFIRTVLFSNGSFFCLNVLFLLVC